MTDAEARETIIKCLDKNLFVIAGAGSGKTSMLVNRMVAMVENGIDISSICAITFTVNAAAEFLERLSATLKRRSQGITVKEDYFQGGLGDIKDKELDKKALDNIDLCFAGTMDSFCNLILSEYPLDANIPSSSSIISEDEEVTLYKQEYASFSREDNPLFNDFARLFKNPSETFAGAIDTVMVASYFDLDYQKNTLNLDDFVKFLKTNYENGIKEGIKKIVYSKESLKDGKGVQDAFAQFMISKDKYLSSWSYDDVINIKYLSKQIGALRYKEDPSISGHIAYVQKGKDYIIDPGCKLLEMVNMIEEYKHSLALEYLLSAAKRVRENLKRKGKLTFNEYLVTFRDLVIKDMDRPGMPLISHIRKRFSHYLIDESQDTSPFQYELFLYLCSREPASRIEEVKLLPGSMFIVGDPKQSIYRFRNADIISYNRVKNLFNDEDNMVVELSNNYRSSALLCSYFNKKFASMDGYTPIGNVDNKDKTDGQGLYTYGSIIDVIKTILHNPLYQISDKGNKRCLDYKDIMIISKKKDNLIDVVKELDRDNIPYYMEGNNYLSIYPVVETIYAIYGYIVNHNSNDYLLNLLASPLFAYKKEELLFVSRLTICEEHAEIFHHLDALLDITNPVILLKKIIDSHELFLHVGYKGMSYAYHLLMMMEDAYKNNTVSSLNDGLLFLEDNLLTPIERTSQLQYKPNAIYLANVHKVKGLEAPVVIMTSDNKGSFPPDRSVDYINNKAYIFLLKSSSNNSQDFNVSFKYPDEVAKEKEEGDKEFKRLQYVAVTRARNYLFINPVGNAWSDLLTDDFKEFNVDDDLINSFNDNKKVITQDDESLKRSVTPSFMKEKTYDIVLPSKLVLSYDHQLEEEDIDESKHDAALKGTLVHALLEDYVNSKMNLDIDVLVNSILDRYSLSSQEEYRQMLVSVVNTMNSGGYIQSDGEREDLFKILSEADEVMCEVPFAYQRNNKIYNGTIDLLYKSHGKYYVVDYKTNYEDDGLDEKYSRQLSAYLYALKQVEGIEAEARIYHIDLLQ